MVLYGTICKFDLRASKVIFYEGNTFVYIIGSIKE
jgi:hypothetical protein